jgi:hypothetical protein
MDITLSAARAEASRRNGAKSRGPKTPEGKARSAQNALKHGLRAEQFVLLHDEDAGAFQAMADALADDLAPVGALQALLARRLVVAAWRLERADRIECQLFALQAERSERGWGRLGLALVRDGNGPGEPPGDPWLGEPAGDRLQVAIACRPDVHRRAPSRRPPRGQACSILGNQICADMRSFNAWEQILPCTASAVFPAGSVRLASDAFSETCAILSSSRTGNWVAPAATSGRSAAAATGTIAAREIRKVENFPAAA